MRENNKDKIDLLIIIPPAGKKNVMWPPYGAMYIASYIRQKGYNPAILNMDTERLSEEEIVKRIKNIAPRYLGFSGMVATSYKYIKGLSKRLRQAFPDTLQILGGALSCAAEPILNNSSIDIVVRGEGEITAFELLKCLDNGGRLADVPGIYYRDDGVCVYSGLRPLIRNLDTLPYPAFDLINMDHYLIDGAEFLNTFTRSLDDKRIYDKKRKKKMVNILTNRGCIGTCSFCVRPDAGLRMYSTKYIFDFIEYCVKKFDVGFLSFGDECLAPTKKRNWEFIEEFRRRKLDIVFRILGMRVDAVDKEILKAYKEIGCCIINYGFESGSQKMLNIVDKRVTVEDNRNAARWTREVGLYTPAQLILGMPGENSETIRETIDFMKSLDLEYKQYKWTYALPIPGSQLYDFARLSGAIEDEDVYLSSIGEIEGSGDFHVNLTDSPDDEVNGWSVILKHELDYVYFRKKFKIKNKKIMAVIQFFMLLDLNLRRKNITSRIVKKIKALFGARDKDAVNEKKLARFRKRKDINVEDFIGTCDCSVVNRNMSLRNINKRLSEREKVYAEKV